MVRYNYRITLRFYLLIPGILNNVAAYYLLVHYLPTSKTTGIENKFNCFLIYFEYHSPWFGHGCIHNLFL